VTQGKDLCGKIKDGPKTNGKGIRNERDTTAEAASLNLREFEEHGLTQEGLFIFLGF